MRNAGFVGHYDFALNLFRADTGGVAPMRNIA